MSFNDDPMQGAGMGAADEDPTGAAALEEDADPSQGAEGAATALDDPSQGLTVGAEDYEDPSAASAGPGEDPTAPPV